MFRGTILLIDRFSRMNTLINSYLSASGFVVECMRSVDDLRTVRLNTIHLALLDIDTAGGRLKEILEQMKSVTGFARPPVSFGGLTVDISKYRAELDGEPLNISPKETALLYLLISSPDTLLRREELSRQLRSSGHASERTVNVFISRLKKAIGRYSANIVSVGGVGYKFDDSV